MSKNKSTGAGDCEGGAALVPPPEQNHANTIDPRLVTRGERLDIDKTNQPHQFAAITDFLNVTFKLHDTTGMTKQFLSQISAFMGLSETNIIERSGGIHGWTRSFNIENTSVLYGTGGQRNTAFLSIPGEACTTISKENWNDLVLLLRDTLDARITRWDGAVDDFRGEHSVDWAVEQYQTGLFKTGGQRPLCRNAGNWTTPDSKGRTFYVGSRVSGKLLRIYEKGKQLGNPKSAWVRWELELHSTNREIPWDAVLNPGPYVAGAYDATSWIKEEACRIKTIKESSKIGYDALVKHARNAYGPLVNVMIEIEGSPQKVVDKLSRPGIPKRLILPVPPELIDQQKQEKES